MISTVVYTPNCFINISDFTQQTYKSVHDILILIAYARREGESGQSRQRLHFSHTQSKNMDKYTKGKIYACL